MKAEEILKLDIKKDLIHFFEEKFIFERKFIPYIVTDREIHVAMTNPHDTNTEMYIKSLSKRRVVITPITEE